MKSPRYNCPDCGMPYTKRGSVYLSVDERALPVACRNVCHEADFSFLQLVTLYPRAA